MNQESGPDQELDAIRLSGLRAAGSHGVHDFERAGSQPFVADLVVFVDSRRAAETDDVNDTVDYSVIADQAAAVLAGSPVALIETLADQLAQVVLAQPLAKGVRVTVHKPAAPVRHQFTDISITIERGRHDFRGLVGDTIVKEAVTGSLAAIAPEPVAEELAVSEPVAAVSVEAAPTSDGPGSKRSALEAAGDAAAHAEALAAGSVHRVVLGLGGNLGDPQETLMRAVEALVDMENFDVNDVSPLIWTAPVLAPEQGPQPDYANAVVLGTTTLSPKQLLRRTSEIEQRLGRTREEPWGARTLDIDIIDVDNMQLQRLSLQLPHPRAFERAFVLLPWAMVDAERRGPDGRSLAELAEVAPDADGVRAIVADWLQGGRTGYQLEGPQRPVTSTPAADLTHAAAGSEPDSDERGAAEGRPSEPAPAEPVLAEPTLPEPARSEPPTSSTPISPSQFAPAPQSTEPAPTGPPAEVPAQAFASPTPKPAVERTATGSFALPAEPWEEVVAKTAVEAEEEAEPPLPIWQFAGPSAARLSGAGSHRWPAPTGPGTPGAEPVAPDADSPAPPVRRRIMRPTPTGMMSVVSWDSDAGGGATGSPEGA